MDRLAKALGDRRSEIEAGIEEARHERDGLRARDRELSALIAEGEALLGKGREPRRTLHEAIAIVLDGEGNRWMHTREIADEVNRRDLYQKRDGSPVEPNQIHARAKNYAHLFDKDGPMIRLRTGDSVAPIPRGRSKYDTLRNHLQSADAETIDMTFDEIDQLVGGLPQSAWDHPAWWANERSGQHVQARSWLGAGFRVGRIDQQQGIAWFEREEDEGDTGLAGVREPRRPSPTAPQKGDSLQPPSEL